LADLVKLIKNKNNTLARQWVADNSSIEPGLFYKELEEELDKVVKLDYKPLAITCLAEYQDMASRSVNLDITTMGLIGRLMAEVEYN